MGIEACGSAYLEIGRFLSIKITHSQTICCLHKLIYLKKLDCQGQTPETANEWSLEFSFTKFRHVYEISFSRALV